MHDIHGSTLLHKGRALLGILHIGSHFPFGYLFWNKQHIFWLVVLSVQLEGHIPGNVCQIFLIRNHAGSGHFHGTF